MFLAIEVISSYAFHNKTALSPSKTKQPRFVISISNICLEARNEIKSFTNNLTWKNSFHLTL